MVLEVSTARNPSLASRGEREPSTRGSEHAAMRGEEALDVLGGEARTEFAADAKHRVDELPSLVHREHWENIWIQPWIRLARGHADEAHVRLFLNVNI